MKSCATDLFQLLLLLIIVIVVGGIAINPFALLSLVTLIKEPGGGFVVVCLCLAVFACLVILILSAILSAGNKSASKCVAKPESKTESAVATIVVVLLGIIASTAVLWHVLR